MTDRCPKAYGLYVVLPDNFREMTAYLHSFHADRTVEVVIAVAGKEYEFTFDDFFARLGILGSRITPARALVDTLTDQEQSILIEQAARRAGLIPREDDTSCVNRPTSV